MQSICSVTGGKNDQQTLQPYITYISVTALKGHLAIRKKQPQKMLFHSHNL